MLARCKMDKRLNISNVLKRIFGSVCSIMLKRVVFFFRIRKPKSIDILKRTLGLCWTNNYY